MRKYILFALPLFLLACNEDPDPTYSHDMETFMGNGGDFTKDSVIYLADSISFIEKLTQSVSFDAQWDKFPALTYKVNAQATAINIRLEMEPSYDGGDIRITCGTRQSSPILFQHPTFPTSNWDGYKLSYRNSIEINDSTYHDILVFDASNASGDYCDFSKFFYSANDGIIKIVSKQGISLNRISPEKYEDIMERLAKERATADSLEQVADSIAKAVADSIANAVADSIEKAVADSIAQAISDSAAKAIADSIVKANKKDTAEIDLDKLIDDVKNCVKDVYSSGKISSLKNCEI